MCKSNVIEPNDKDLTKLILPLIKQQLEDNDSEYDGSTLVLNGRELYVDDK